MFGSFHAHPALRLDYLECTPVTPRCQPSHRTTNTIRFISEEQPARRGIRAGKDLDCWSVRGERPLTGTVKGTDFLEVPLIRVPDKSLILHTSSTENGSENRSDKSAPAWRRLSPSCTVALRPRASAPSHSAPAASHRSPGLCGLPARNRLGTHAPPLSHYRCGAGKFRHPRAPPTRWPQSASQA